MVQFGCKCTASYSARYALHFHLLIRGLLFALYTAMSFTCLSPKLIDARTAGGLCPCA